MAQIKNLKLTDEILTADETSGLVQTAKEEIAADIGKKVTTQNVDASVAIQAPQMTASHMCTSGLHAQGDIYACNLVSRYSVGIDCTHAGQLWLSYPGLCVLGRHCTEYLFNDGTEDNSVVRFKDLTNLGGSAIDSTRLHAVEVKAQANKTSITDLDGRVTLVENGLTDIDGRVAFADDLARCVNACVYSLDSAIREVADSYSGVVSCISYLASTKQDALTENIIASNLGSANPDDEDAVTSGTDQANLNNGGFLMGTLAEFDVTGGASAVMPEEISLFRRAGGDHPNINSMLFLRVLRWDGDKWYVAYQAKRGVTHNEYTLNGQRMRHPMAYVAGSVYIPVDETILIGYATDPDAPASDSLAPTGLRLALRDNSSPVKHVFGNQSSLPTSPSNAPTTGDRYAHVFAMVVTGKGQADLANALDKKQDTVTAGDGIAINNDTVSVRLAYQKSVLRFDDGGLAVNVSCTSCDSHEITALGDQLHNTFIDAEGFLVVLPPNGTTYGAVRLDSGTLSTEAYTAATGTAVKAELEKYYTKEEVDGLVEDVEAELTTCLSSKQGKLKAGDNIDIADDGTISATGGSGGSVTVDTELSDTSTNPIQNQWLGKRMGATASNSVQIGYSAKASSTPNVAIGQQGYSDYGGQVAVGYGAVGTCCGVAVGYCSVGASSGVAVGFNAVGNDYGVAVGNSTTGAGFTVAIGHGAKASVATPIVIGTDNYASAKITVSKAGVLMVGDNVFVTEADFNGHRHCASEVDFWTGTTDQGDITIGSNTFASTSQVKVTKEGVMTIGGKQVAMKSDIGTGGQTPAQVNSYEFVALCAGSDVSRASYSYTTISHRSADGNERIYWFDEGDYGIVRFKDLEGLCGASVDLSDYYTKSQTDNAITNALKDKQNTLTQGTGISLSGSTISVDAVSSIDDSAKPVQSLAVKSAICSLEAVIGNINELLEDI